MLFVPQWLYPSSPPNAVDDAAQPESLAAKLKHFDGQGELPPSSRINLSLEQREYQGRSLADIWKYGLFLASKATDIASDLVRHKLVGARKKSWGIEMTILSALMRDMGKNSSLADLPMLRTLMHISGLAPVPSDAIVTPVTFRARKRDLPGFLAASDAAEDGTRVLSGEWIVGTRLWRALQHEWRRAKADKNGRRPRHHRHQRVILFLHGGAYYMFSAATHRTITIPLSKHTDARVFALDYRLAPEMRFPGQLHDAVLAYLRLIEDLHIPPQNIVVCGDSAGGGLTMALLLYLRDNHFPLPAASMLMSPWVDLTMSCDSWDSNAEFDLVPIPVSGDHLNPISCLLGPDGMAQYLTHPYASPLFGDMKGLPPLLIQTGDAEVLRDESMLLAHKATLAGVEVRHEIYEDQVHVFQMFFFLEAAQKAMLSCREFANNIWRQRSGSGPKELGKDAEADLEREMNNQAARIVRGDGSVVDYKRPFDLPGMDTSAQSSSEGTPRTSSDVEPSWTQAATDAHQEPQTRDGTGIHPDTEEEGDQPSSPISLKPKRYDRRTLTDSSTLKEKPPAPSRSHSLFGWKHSSNASSSLVEQPAKGLVNTPSRRKPQIHLNLTQNAPPVFPSQRSPSVPSIRKRERATSHPDVFQLCQSWAETGPANDPVMVEVGHNEE